MANVYYRVNGSTIYYTNEAKEGYTLRPNDSQVSSGKFAIVELYNDKFILPEISSNLFLAATNTSFEDRRLRRAPLLAEGARSCVSLG